MLLAKPITEAVTASIFLVTHGKALDVRQSQLDYWAVLRRVRGFFAGDSSLLVFAPTFDSPLFGEEPSKHPIPNPKPNKLNPLLIARAVLSLSASTGSSNNLFVISHILS